MTDAPLAAIIIIWITSLMTVSWTVVWFQRAAWQKKHGGHRIFVLKNGEELGPYFEDQISEFVKSGWLASSHSPSTSHVRPEIVDPGPLLAGVLC